MRDDNFASLRLRSGGEIRAWQKKADDIIKVGSFSAFPGRAGALRNQARDLEPDKPGGLELKDAGTSRQVSGWTRKVCGLRLRNGDRGMVLH